jgi:hypothetical protein
MKNQFKISILLGIVFSWLFYEQALGINTIVMSVVLIAVLLIRYPFSRRDPFSLFSMVCTLVSAMSIYLVNSTVSYIAWTASILNLILVKEKVQLSILNSVVTFVLNFFASPVMMFIREKKEPAEEDQESTRFTSMAGYLFIVLIVIIFFIIYQSANPLFYEYTKEINFDNISVGFILFCILGTLLMTAFFFRTFVNALFQWEEAQVKDIKLRNVPVPVQKIKMFTLLFIVLNAMLIFINALDINYLYLSHKLPDGITNSQFVHNGVNTIILSILLGASIMCYLFRDDINFESSGKVLKMLAYAWIAQNVFMVISTIIRNCLYIHNYALSERRVGVYYYLGCTLIGLSFLFYKIYKAKTAYFLYAKNSFVFYTILVLSSLVNWGNLIYQYNYSFYLRHNYIDPHYAISFTSTNLPEIISYTSYGRGPCDNTVSVPNSIPKSCEFYHRINQDFYNYLDAHFAKEWKSSSVADNKMYEKLQKLDAQHQFEYMDLTDIYTYSFQHNALWSLSHFSNVKYLIIPDAISLRSLHLLKNVEAVRWDGTNAESIAYFKSLKKLKTLELPNFAESYIKQLQPFFPGIQVTK